MAVVIVVPVPVPAPVPGAVPVDVVERASAQTRLASRPLTIIVSSGLITCARFLAITLTVTSPFTALASLGNADWMGVARSSSRSATCVDSTQAAVVAIAARQPLQDDEEHRHHCPH